MEVTLKQHKNLHPRQKRDIYETDFELYLPMTKELKGEFESFLKEYKAKSELCQYLALFQDIIRTVKNLVVAHRYRYWDLHVDAAQFMPFFEVSTQ